MVEQYSKIQPIAEVIQNRLGVEIAWIDPPGCFRPKVGAQLCSLEAVKQPEAEHTAELAELRTVTDAARLRANIASDAFKIASAENSRLQQNLANAVRILAAVHATIYPQLAAAEDGTTYRFNAPNPHDYLQALGDTIRAIPEKINALTPISEMVTIRRSSLSTIVTALEHEGDEGSPFHMHDVSGIWDNDMGDKAGTPCEECAAFNELREALK